MNRPPEPFAGAAVEAPPPAEEAQGENDAALLVDAAPPAPMPPGDELLPHDAALADEFGRPRKKRRSKVRLAIEWVAVVGGALLVALVIQATAFKTYYIPSTSMVPTLEVNDRVIVNRLSYRGSASPQRGQIIVFTRPAAAPPSEIEELIKRVIAVGGDTIEARDGRVYVNDAPLVEDYLTAGTTTANLPRQQIPPDAVFVLGDNRNFSSDSRVWGVVDEDLIIGRAMVRIWPLGRIGGI